MPTHVVKPGKSENEMETDSKYSGSTAILFRSASTMILQETGHFHRSGLMRKIQKMLTWARFVPIHNLHLPVRSAIPGFSTELTPPKLGRTRMLVSELFPPHSF